MEDRSAGLSAPRGAEYWNSAATESWAERHELIDGLFSGLTQVALDLAAPQLGERVLDIGCGSGTTLLELAARVGSGGYVLGADVSRRSLARAWERIAGAGLRQAEAVVADVSTHDFAPNSFDLAFSRFGVMFFSDPTAAFINLRKAMKPGGRLALTVFRTPQENGWSTAPVAALRHLLPPTAPPGPEEPGQFSWADPARVHRILESAGFRDVSLTPHDPEIRLARAGAVAEAVDAAMHFGPAARATLGATAAQRESVRAGLESFFRSLDGPQGIVLPGAVWVVRGRS